MKKLRIVLFLLIMALTLTPLTASATEDGANADSSTGAQGTGGLGTGGIYTWQDWIGLRVYFVYAESDGEHKAGDLVEGSRPYDFYRHDSHTNFDFENAMYFDQTKLKIKEAYDKEYDLDSLQLKTSGYTDISNSTQYKGIPKFVHRMDSTNTPACDRMVLEEYIWSRIYDFAGPLRCNARKCLVSAKYGSVAYVNNSGNTTEFAAKAGTNHPILYKEYNMIVEPLMYFHNNYKGGSSFVFTSTELGILRDRGIVTPDGKETLIKYNFPRAMYLETDEAALGIKRPNEAHVATSNHDFQSTELIERMGIWVYHGEEVSEDTEVPYYYQYYYRDNDSPLQYDPELTLERKGEVEDIVTDNKSKRGLKEGYYLFQTIWGSGDNQSENPEGMVITEYPQQNVIKNIYHRVEDEDSGCIIERWYSDDYDADGNPLGYHRGTAIDDTETLRPIEIGTEYTYPAAKYYKGYVLDYILYDGDPSATFITIEPGVENNVIRVFYKKAYPPPPDCAIVDVQYRFDGVVDDSKTRRGLAFPEGTTVRADDFYVLYEGYTYQGGTPEEYVAVAGEHVTITLDYSIRVNPPEPVVVNVFYYFDNVHYPQYDTEYEADLGDIVTYMQFLLPEATLAAQASIDGKSSYVLDEVLNKALYVSEITELNYIRIYYKSNEFVELPPLTYVDMYAESCTAREGTTIYLQATASYGNRERDMETAVDGNIDYLEKFNIGYTDIIEHPVAMLQRNNPKAFNIGCTWDEWPEERSEYDSWLAETGSDIWYDAITMQCTFTVTGLGPLDGTYMSKKYYVSSGAEQVLWYKLDIPDGIVDVQDGTKTGWVDYKVTISWGAQTRTLLDRKTFTIHDWDERVPYTPTNMDSINSTVKNDYGVTVGKYNKDATNYSNLQVNMNQIFNVPSSTKTPGTSVNEYSYWTDWMYSQNFLAEQAKVTKDHARGYILSWQQNDPCVHWRTAYYPIYGTDGEGNSIVVGTGSYSYQQHSYDVNTYSQTGSRKWAYFADVYEHRFAMNEYEVELIGAETDLYMIPNILEFVEYTNYGKTAVIESGYPVVVTASAGTDEFQFTNTFLGDPTTPGPLTVLGYKADRVDECIRYQYKTAWYPEMYYKWISQTPGFLQAV